MKNVTTIRQPEVQRRKAVLEAALADLLAAAGKREELTVERLPDPVDQLVSHVEREVAGRRLDEGAHKIREVRDAIERIEQGSFGVCERCELPIQAKRLDAVPWALLCVQCQAEAERGGSGFAHAA